MAGADFKNRDVAVEMILLHDDDDGARIQCEAIKPTAMDDDDTNDNLVEGEDDDQVDNDEEEDAADADEQGGEDGAGGGTSEPVMAIPAVPNLDSLYGLREIGREALCWQLSSAKPGNGVEQIRDQSTDTYWQSDGVSQPHWIQVHFGRRVALSHVCLYLDYNLDESYTPKHLSVQVGMTTQDLTPAIYPVNTLVELNEPVGWCVSTFIFRSTTNST
jgi:anaphase-promoting complex subunit 10